jgi:AcrR family transcriptional regulator
MAVAVSMKTKRPTPSARTKAMLEPLRDAERTRQALLAAAEIEFSAKGLSGARVDVIAEQASANKRMLYYYFGSKEELYLAVLERAYSAMRTAERELNLINLAPLDAIRRLVEFKFDYCQQHQQIITLLAGENMLGARYLKRSRRLRDVNLSLVDAIRALLDSGAATGEIKPGIDPLQLYISMSALSYFYFSNSATLSVAFARQLDSPTERALRRVHAVEVIMAYVKAP